jgi:hypothetical protein
LDRNAAVEADSVGQFHDAAGRLHRFLGETAAAQHAIADLHAFGADTELHNLAGGLATGDERRLGPYVVLPGDPQHIGIAHASGMQANLDLARSRDRRVHRLHHKTVWPAVGFTHHDLHVSGSLSACRSLGGCGEPHHLLADIAARQHVDERGWSRLETFGDRLAEFEPAGAEPIHQLIERLVTSREMAADAEPAEHDTPVEDDTAVLR